VQGVRFVIEFLSSQCDGDKHEQPKQWIASDLLQEKLHGNATVSFADARHS
jgi:hypothetical protein